MEKGDDDHRRRKSSIRIVDEFDFLNENRTGPKHTYLLAPLEAPLKEIMFPEILNSPATSPRRKGKEKINVMVDQQSENDATTNTGSTKRNPNSDQGEEEEEEEIPPWFHPRVIQHCQDNRPVFLFDKNLDSSDVGRSQNRLVITGGYRLVAALTEEEKGDMEKEGEGSVFLEVITVDPRGVEYKMRLQKGDAMGGVVLSHEWFKLVSENELEKGDSVQGWGYRAADKFRLAITIIRHLCIN